MMKINSFLNVKIEVPWATNAMFAYGIMNY